MMEREQRIQLEDSLATAKQMEHVREMKEVYCVVQNIDISYQMFCQEK